MKSAQIVSQLLREAAAMVKPGMTGVEIDEYIDRRIVELGAKSYNKGYKPGWAPSPFPTATCIGVNNIVVHGIPTRKPFEEGDLVIIDIGIVDKDGMCGDAGLTVGVGKLSNKRERLLRHARQCLDEAIKVIGPGVNTRMITQTIERYAISRGYKPFKTWSGHHIGKEMHMKPSIYNTVEPDRVWSVLRSGDVICVEPIMTNGKDQLGLWQSDGWTVKTADGKDVGFFEHMIEITDDGCRVLTDHI